MATHNPSRKTVGANDHKPAELPGGWKYRLAKPILFAAVGITLGTLTGLAVAILSTPGGATGLSTVFANTGSTGPSLDAAYKPTQQAHSTALAQVAGHLAANKVAIVTPKAIRMADVDRSTRAHFIHRKVQAGAETLTIRAAHRKHHSGRHVTHPHTKPTLIEEANASLAGPMPMTVADEPLNLDGEAMSSNFYTEGDLTVADYDANAGTIETSDGRTFVVGITVAVSNAAPWSEYRSNLHYRCSRTGSCALSRAGAVAPNARLI